MVVQIRRQKKNVSTAIFFKIYYNLENVFYLQILPQNPFFMDDSKLEHFLIADRSQTILSFKTFINDENVH